MKDRQKRDKQKEWYKDRMMNRKTVRQSKKNDKQINEQNLTQTSKKTDTDKQRQVNKETQRQIKNIETCKRKTHINLQRGIQT